MKDDTNVPLLGFSGPAGFCLAYEAEDMALLTGLKLAKERNFLPLILEGDSKCVTSWAMNGVSFPWKIANIEEEILDLSANLSLSFVTVPREISGEADTLAKRGVTRYQLAS